MVITDAGRSSTKYYRTRNDCTVVALSMGLCIPYMDAHNKLKEAGRVTGKSFDFDTYAKNQGWKWISFPAKKNEKRFTPDTAAIKLGEGQYILRCAHHVCAIIDGIAYDTIDSSKKCVYGAWKIT